MTDLGVFFRGLERALERRRTRILLLALFFFTFLLSSAVWFAWSSLAPETRETVTVTANGLFASLMVAMLTSTIIVAFFTIKSDTVTNEPPMSGGVEREYESWKPKYKEGMKLGGFLPLSKTSLLSRLERRFKLNSHRK